MARKKTVKASAPTPDLTFTLRGNAMTSPDVTLFERGNLFVSADGKAKMIFKGNTVDCFGIGGKGKTETGAFTTPEDPNTLKVSFTDLTEKPDVINVTMHMEGGVTTHAFWIDGIGSYWDLVPFEDALYRITEEGIETGIIKNENDGFTFRTNAPNTKNLQAEYVAIKYTE